MEQFLTLNHLTRLRDRLLELFEKASEPTQALAIADRIMRLAQLHQRLSAPPRPASARPARPRPAQAPADAAPALPNVPPAPEPNEPEPGGPEPQAPAWPADLPPVLATLTPKRPEQFGRQDRRLLHHQMIEGFGLVPRPVYKIMRQTGMIVPGPQPRLTPEATDFFASNRAVELKMES